MPPLMLFSEYIFRVGGTEVA